MDMGTKLSSIENSWNLGTSYGVNSLHQDLSQYEKK